MKKHDAATKVAHALGPVDVATTATTGGDWIDLSLYDSLMAIVNATADADAGAATVRLRQATSSGGAGAKNLNGVKWYLSEHATALDDSWTESDDTASLAGNEVNIARCEVTADQLDVANNFRYVQVQFSRGSANTGKLVNGVYVLRGARYVAEVTDQPNVLG